MPSYIHNNFSIKNLGLAGLAIMTLVFAGGCAKLNNLQELLTLKSLSEDQDRQSKQVERQEANYKKVLKVAEKNEFSQFKTTEEFRKSFGDPILIKSIERDGTHLEEWLYCHPANVLKSSRVYAYFDPAGQLVDSKFVKALESTVEAHP